MLDFKFKPRLSFRNCISCVYNCDDLPSNNSLLRSSHIWFSYIQNFIIILSRVYNEPIQRPAPSWLVSLIGRALHRYRRGQGFESRTSLNFFFRLSFHNCISSLRSSHIWLLHIQNLISLFLSIVLVMYDSMSLKQANINFYPRMKLNLKFDLIFGEWGLKRRGFWLKKILRRKKK